MNEQAEKQNDQFREWAIVDVMGHQRFVGQVSEQVIAGQGFIRVDIPQTNDEAAWTKLIGTASIYAITPVSETIARKLAERNSATPVSRYEFEGGLQQRLQYTPDDVEEDDEF